MRNFEFNVMNNVKTHFTFNFELTRDNINV